MKIYLKEWKEAPYDKHDYETVSVYTNLEKLRTSILKKAGYKRLTNIEANEIYEKDGTFPERIRIREMEVR